MNYSHKSRAVGASGKAPAAQSPPFAVVGNLSRARVPSPEGQRTNDTQSLHSITTRGGEGGHGSRILQETGLRGEEGLQHTHTHTYSLKQNCLSAASSDYHCPLLMHNMRNEEQLDTPPPSTPQSSIWIISFNCASKSTLHISGRFKSQRVQHKETCSTNDL